MEPDVWRRDVRRAKERIGKGQVLIVSVLGTPSGEDVEALIEDYAPCARWAAEAGADAVEVQLAWPDPFADQPQVIYENVPLAAQILHPYRTSVAVPVLAKLGAFKTPRILHETATKLAPWAGGFVLVHGFPRRVVDERGNAAFEGTGRERADIVGGDTFRPPPGKWPRCCPGAAPGAGTAPCWGSGGSRRSSGPDAPARGRRRRAAGDRCALGSVVRRPFPSGARLGRRLTASPPRR